MADMDVFFHFAFPVRDIKATKKFYQEVLGCTLGRKAHNWVDINFFGHQLTAHHQPDLEVSQRMNSSGVPQLHFGAILPWREWHRLKDKLEEMGIPFFIPPTMVFPGQVGEQMSMFVQDPSGYAIEFKAFEEPGRIFKAK
jgi:extradiol dioxygenase family protein